MYYANLDYNTEKSMHVIKSRKLRQESKDLLVKACEEEREKIREYKQATRFENTKRNKKKPSLIGLAPKSKKTGIREGGKFRGPEKNQQTRGKNKR